jgi:hypothetical protein
MPGRSAESSAVSASASWMHPDADYARHTAHILGNLSAVAQTEKQRHHNSRIEEKTTHLFYLLYFPDLSSGTLAGLRWLRWCCVKIRFLFGCTLPLSALSLLIGLACLLGGYVLIGGAVMLISAVWTLLSCLSLASSLMELD